MMATMHRMPSQIDLYEEMSLLSARMVDAARAGEWDSLIELERDVTGLRNALMASRTIAIHRPATWPASAA
jgi:flagellar protein FliT